MSLQPSSARILPVADADEAGSLVFGGVSIPKAVVAKIWGQVTDGVRLLPRGGAEVGGLLVGPKARESGVVVDGIIPLPIEYKFGPSFRMSASDIAKIPALVEAAQADASKAVVGFYRSRTRGDETLRDSDREIFAAIEQAHTSFATDFLCSFVLAPISSSERLACVSMRNGANWDEVQFTLPASLFSVAEAPSSVPQQASAPAEAKLSRPPEASRVIAVAQTNPTPRVWRRSKLLYALLYAGTGLLVLGSAAGGYRWVAKNRPQANAVTLTQTTSLRMGFSANREGPVWKLWWDRGAMEVMKPSGAVLAIKDGAREQQLNLTPADISNGTIFYTPQGGDLTFSLQLERSGAAPLEEHIRILEGSGSVQEPVAKAPQTASNTSSNSVPNVVAPNVVPSVAANSAIVPAVASPRSVSGKTPISPLLSARLQAKPAPVETPQAPTILRDAPPDVETPQAPAVAFAVPVAPRIAPPVVELPPAPERASTPTAVAVAATAPTPAKLNYVGPKPVQQVRPQPPPKGNSSGLQIQIRVEIDAGGKVTNATPVGVTATNFPVILPAVRAARAWQFEPAKLDGKPIPSEMDLVFRF